MSEGGLGLTELDKRKKEKEMDEYFLVFAGLDETKIYECNSIYMRI